MSNFFIDSDIDSITDIQPELFHYIGSKVNIGNNYGTVVYIDEYSVTISINGTNDIVVLATYLVEITKLRFLKT